jgi:hypothetical protein
MRSLLLTDPLDSFLALAGVGTTFRPKPHYRCSERHGGQPPYRRKGQLQFAEPSKMGLEIGMKTVVLSLLIAQRPHGRTISRIRGTCTTFSANG